jgi:uncharacterized membrane protein YfcA
MVDLSSPFNLLVLLSLGVFGGVVSTMVGGSILVVVPAMLALGFPITVAIATYGVAILPAGMVGAFADWRSGPRLDRPFVVNILLSLLGGGLGALLLTRTSESFLSLLIPILVGGTTILFALGPYLRKRWSALREEASDNRRGMRLIAFLAFLYGGYFGAGLGIILLTIFANAGMDLRRANVMKNLLSSINAATAVMVFIVNGLVEPAAASVILVGGVLGGYAGGRIVMKIRAEKFHVIVVAAGAAMTVVYSVRYWLR